MPEPVYEYHLLYYSATGKLEPPLGGDWRIYKSRVSRNAVGATVLWRRPIAEPEKQEVSEPRTLQLNCISGSTLCQGPYGPDKDHEHSIYKCGACSEYELKFSSGKATFKEMLEGCEGFLKARVGPLPNGEADSDMVRDVRLHVTLHGYPSISEELKLKVETLFHALYSKFTS